MKFTQISILFVGLIAVAAATPKISLPIDFFAPKKIRNMIEIGREHGYLIEEHNVTTADGYILKTYRIPPGKNCGYKTEKKPILFLHGVLSSTFDFIAGGPKKSLAYKMADNCYDVWMKNSKGNSVSREHINMTETDPKFWDFSWHEMGVYDIPKLVDYILNATNETSLHFLGHSQGTTEFFVFASSLPEYRRKIVSAQLMAPVAYFNYFENLFLGIAAQFAQLIEVVLSNLKIYDTEIFCALVREFGSTYCQEDLYPEISDFCVVLYYLFAGLDEPETNSTSLFTFFPNFPSGASTKQLYHYAQTIRSHKFSQYDYGAEKNQELYGSAIPPNYNISSIDVPVAMYYAPNDFMVSIKEAESLAKLIPNLIEYYEVPFSKFTHMDFIVGTDANVLVWSRIVEVLDKFK